MVLPISFIMFCIIINPQLLLNSFLLNTLLVSLYTNYLFLEILIVLCLFCDSIQIFVSYVLDVSVVFSKIGTDFYLLKSSAIICLCLVLVNGNGSKTGHFGNGSRTGNFVLRVGGTGRRDILAKRNQGFNSVVGGQLTLPHDVSQLLKTHFHSGQLLPEPAFLLALAHTLPLHYYLLSCSNYCQRFYIISYLLLIYHTSLRTKLPSKYRSAITISSIPIRRYCSLFFSLLEMQPFVIGLVFLENVHVFPAAMVDAFASAIEKNEGRNRSDIIEFFQCCDAFVTEGDAQPRHALGECVIVLLALVQAYIYHLKSLALQINLFVVPLEHAEELFGYVTLHYQCLTHYAANSIRVTGLSFRMLTLSTVSSVLRRRMKRVPRSKGFFLSRGFSSFGGINSLNSVSSIQTIIQLPHQQQSEQYCAQMIRMDTGNVLFQLLRTLRLRRNYKPQVQALLFLGYLLADLTLFLSLRNVALLPPTLIDSTALALFVGAFAGLLLCEIVICIAAKKQFYLLVQISAFCLVCSQLALHYLLADQTELLINRSIIWVLMVCLLLFGAGATIVAVKESINARCLYIPDLPITFLLFLASTLLNIYNFCERATNQLAALLLFGTLSLYTRTKHFEELQEESMEYRLLSAIVLNHIWYFVVLLAHFFSQFLVGNGVFSQLVYLLAPLVMCSVVSQLLRKKVVQVDFERVFKSQTTFMEFVKVVQTLTDDIDRFSEFQNTDFSDTYIFLFCSQHMVLCGGVTCELNHESTKEQLRNSNEPKNIKLLIHKTLKKIESLFEEYANNDPQDYALKLSFLKFCAKYLPNRAKICELASEVAESDLNWTMSQELHEVRAQAESMASNEMIEGISASDQYAQFENLTYWTLGCMTEFWLQFSEQKVDLSQLMLISARLFPLKARIEVVWRNQLEEEKFSSWKILKLYSLYCRRIINDTQGANIVDSYIAVLGERLREAKDINYLTTETEVGIIAISLSESSLGQIVMVNQQTCQKFNYKRQQFLRKRVNDIMPCLYSETHDDILTAFLKNKAKKINTDKRPMFGKNKNGHIFPITLQLQRVCFTPNDELIFIANMQLQKYNTAPVCCITDSYGTVLDFTSTFGFLFFKHEDKPGTKNIQELVPSFFQNIEEMLNSRHIVHFPERVHVTKKYQEGMFTFEAECLVVQAQPLGYLVQAKREKSTLGKVEQTKASQYAYPNIYDMDSNSYKLANQHSGNDEWETIKRQFTIPYIRCGDLEGILYLANEQAEAIDYGGGIRTIRLTAGHFERVNTEESFHSEESEDRRRGEIKQKIEQMKLTLTKKEEKNFLFYFRLLVHTLLLCVIAASIALLFELTASSEGQSKAVQLFQFGNQVRSALPEYIVYYQLSSLSEDKSRLNQIQEQIITSVMNAPITQQQKQSILQIVYLRSQADLNELLHAAGISSAGESLGFQGWLQQMVSLWRVVVSLMAFVTLAQLLILYMFRNSLLSIYSVFLGLEEQTIRRINEECKTLSCLIQSESQTGGKPLPESRPTEGRAVENRLGEGRVNEQQSQEGHNEFQKARKFKNSSRSNDWVYVAKLVFPAGLLLAYSIVALALMPTLSRTYQEAQDVYIQCSTLLPESSIEFLDSYLVTTEQKQLRQGSNYTAMMETIEKVIHENIQDPQPYMDILMGDICSDNIGSPITAAKYCQKLPTAIKGTGLSEALNYVQVELLNVQENAHLSNRADPLFGLAAVQYDYIQPTMLYMLGLIEQQMQQELARFRQIYTVFCILLICALVSFDGYVMLYPLNSLAEEINFTKDLIKLMPAIKDNTAARRLYWADQTPDSP